MKYWLLALGVSAAFLSLEESHEIGNPAYALRTQSSNSVSKTLSPTYQLDSDSNTNDVRSVLDKSINIDINTYTGFANSIKFLTGVFPDDDEMPDHLRLKNLDDQVGFDTIDSVYTLIMAVRNGCLSISEITSEDMSKFYKVWNHYDRGPIALYLDLRPEVMLEHFIDFSTSYNRLNTL